MSAAPSSSTWRGGTWRTWEWQRWVIWRGSCRGSESSTGTAAPAKPDGCNKQPLPALLLPLLLPTTSSAWPLTSWPTTRTSWSMTSHLNQNLLTGTQRTNHMIRQCLVISPTDQSAFRRWSQTFIYLQQTVFRWWSVSAGPVVTTETDCQIRCQGSSARLPVHCKKMSSVFLQISASCRLFSLTNTLQLL